MGRPIRTPKIIIPTEASLPAEEDEALIKEEPDEQGLAQASEEWNELAMEDPAEILEDPAIALELSEDPVRLYLKEIGQIHLLDADSEFRLAARIEAERRLKSVEKHITPVYGKPNHYRSLFFGVVQDLVTFWERLQEDADRLNQGAPPDLSLILSEAQMLRRQWQADRTFLPAFVSG